MADKLYKIIRYYAPGQNRENETIQKDLTLEEAQEHCQDPSTSEKDVYFDGYQPQED